MIHSFYFAFTRFFPLQVVVVCSNNLSFPIDDLVEKFLMSFSLFQLHFLWKKKKSGAKSVFQKNVFFVQNFLFFLNKMWVLKSFSKVVVAGPFKSQTEMAKKLGVSHQYVNRQIKQNKFIFQLDGQKVVASREKEFVGGGKSSSNKDELAFRLGVSRKAVEKVLAKHTSGVVQTPQGEVKIQKLKPGKKPALPAVRVLWNDDTEKQDFVSFAAAAKELKIHPKTIPSAIKAGRNSFTRKSDGKQFTFEIPEENTPSRKKPKPPSDEQKQKWAEMKRENEIREEYRKHALWGYQDTPIEEMERLNKLRANTAGPSAEKEEEAESTEEGPPPRPEGAQLPEEAQPPAPRKKVLQTPVPAPRRKNLPPPIPAPRRKNLPPPIPAPRPVPEGAQPPAPRKKVSFEPPPREEEEDESEEEEEEETGYTELMEMKTWEVIEKKYPDYWCPPTVRKSDITIMLLFHVVTGEYAKVHSYHNIEEFFQQRGYSSYLTEKLFEEKKRAGDVLFQACRGKKTESWFRLILCKAERTCPTFEEHKKQMKAAERELRQRKNRLECCWFKEFLESPRPKPKPLPPPPAEVVEIRNSGQKINFQNSASLSCATFDSPKSVAAYIRSGLRQKIFWTGPKNRQTVIIDNHEVYLPDLVKEIIVFHIRGKLWKEGDAEARAQWVELQADNMGKGEAKTKCKQLIFMRKTRNLEPLAIAEITKKLASFI